jgi:hypothetical protein
MSESDPSNVATGTPVDTIAPVIDHTPTTEAPPGLSLTLHADVTDNVAVHKVTLYYRAIGATSYLSKTMVNTSGDRYSATIEGAQINSPGMEYYIEAGDGVSTARDGRAAYPYQVLVQDTPVITTVSPNHGPASGGTAVVLSGSNFKAGATVTLGGAVAEDATVVSSSQITCTTPAHYPAVVDVTVTNPDDQSDTLLQSFTYESEIVTLSMPDTGGGQHDVLQVPIHAADVEGLGAASLTVTFDSSVLSAQDASAGSLTPGWSVEANTSTTGEIRITMAGGGSTTSGSGVLAYVEFEVLGASGDTSALGLTDISLNDGAIQVASTDGSFAVSLVYDVAGTVRFWKDNTGVSNTQLTLAGDRLYAGTTDTNGQYVVRGAEADDYTLTPEKSDGANGISAYDASLALQHDAGLITLSGHAVTAADVNQKNGVTSMDAFYILEHAAGLSTLPFQGAGQMWAFSPTERTYTDLSSDVSGQDFTAVLIGDPSGNWAPTGAMRARQASGNAIVQVRDASPDPTGAVTTTVWLDPQGAAVHGIDLTLTYDVEAITPDAVTLGTLGATWTSAANLNDPGSMHLSIAGAEALTEAVPLLTLRATLREGVSETTIALSRGDLDEGTIAATLVDGSIFSHRTIYLPLILNR